MAGRLEPCLEQYSRRRTRRMSSRMGLCCAGGRLAPCMSICATGSFQRLSASGLATLVMFVGRRPSDD